MNTSNNGIKHVVVDECYQPLLEQFDQQVYREEDLQVLSQMLVDPSSSKKHEACIGIYRLYMANRGLLNKIVASGTLIKLNYFLKQQQFPQLCFEALRVIFFAVQKTQISQFFVSSGAVYSLLNLIDKQNHRAILGLSLWSLAKIVNRATGDSIVPLMEINQFLDICDIAERIKEANLAIAHLVIKIYKNHVLLRAEDLDRFLDLLLDEIIQVNVTNPQLLKEAFQFLSSKWNQIADRVAADNWKSLRSVLEKIQNHPAEILVHYLNFLLQIQPKVSFYDYADVLVSFDILSIFQSVLVETNQQARLSFCLLCATVLATRNVAHLKYFLSKQSILIKFYYMIESDQVKVKGEVCRLFTVLTIYQVEDVLHLFEEAKIVAIYYRLLKEVPELVDICLECLIVVLQFAEKMSLTTLNWFLNYLRSEKIEENLDRMEQETQSNKRKKYIEILRDILIVKQIQPGADK